MNTQIYYTGSSNSLYFYATKLYLSAYDFDILKRVTRCRHKGKFEEDINKSIDVAKICQAEYSHTIEKQLNLISGRENSVNLAVKYMNDLFTDFSLNVKEQIIIKELVKTNFDKYDNIIKLLKEYGRDKK